MNNEALDPTNIVEADRDPKTVEIEQLRKNADEDADFAEAEAAFARREWQHGTHLQQEHRDDEGIAFKQRATQHMAEAGEVLDEANQEAAEADEREAQQKKRLAVALRDMPNQNVATLREAVGAVRVFVQELQPSDKLRVCMAAQMDEQCFDAIASQVVTTGLAIEEALGSHQRVKNNPVRVVQDLVSFVAAAMTIADHLEPLMRLIQQYGHFLLQFYIY